MGAEPVIYFDWDRKKEQENLRKHGLNFELASTVLDDPAVVFRQDDYPEEDRQQAIGMVGGVLLILVVYTEGYVDTDDSYIRIISARKAEPAERRLYRRGYA